MPAFSVDKPAIASLKTYRIMTGLDYAYMALRFDKDPLNSTQVIDTDQFEMDWGITNTTLLSYLQTLETRKVLKVTPTAVTINWTENETTTITQAEVLSLKKEGLISNTTYAYYALLLNKGAGLSQVVDPTVYAASPWMIDASSLMQELVNISNRKNESALTPVITVDLTSVSVIWLI